ncbi:uncharacterized protein [Spinacia oleracea]|uniref:Uncharacterized protein LOC110785949 n=1 Tax=Spinacia oleracea TaxID=3562 RepID=A0A9R0IBC4_SPIOL|nr:uncharacterized protein LOC110785949 [Spinacia oleracea]XP_056682319.1 uncharacterized protein LOC110785949 [Spinacia oleracea]XP_056682320.1 uncharacterized protein LOC110785949 [Spinacia oleracea]XP_056682321.1 uncharacterized protein LOC110785949 [Spinacia oleracea]
MEYVALEGRSSGSVLTYIGGSGNQYKGLVDCVKTIVREEGGPALLKVFTNFLLIVMMHATCPYEEFQSRRILCCNLELLKLEPIKLVAVVIDMTKLMRCFLKTTSGSAIKQFSKFLENNDDTSDGGGAPVFTFLSISAHGLGTRRMTLIQREVFSCCIEQGGQRIGEG